MLALVSGGDGHDGGDLVGEGGADAVLVVERGGGKALADGRDEPVGEFGGDLLIGEPEVKIGKGVGHCGGRVGGGAAAGGVEDVAEEPFDRGEFVFDCEAGGLVGGRDGGLGGGKARLGAGRGHGFDRGSCFHACACPVADGDELVLDRGRTGNGGRFGLRLRVGCCAHGRTGLLLFGANRARFRVGGSGDLDDRPGADAEDSAGLEGACVEDDGIGAEVSLDLGEGCRHGTAAIGLECHHRHPWLVEDSGNLHGVARFRQWLLFMPR